ncbi:MAG: DUF885 domain-containing protein [Shewanella sp.]|nr:DUF885 domain-containing protein [Shewanella sp.]MCF1430862.1 DUF885 domain-containing protein [Shewanella sp.]MCF1438188.1 DUF885 domain-containing protein [Shewanella sp.]MCF1457493.1 DUF885 domain-containing protein [Shewanella sp.]
MHKLALGVATSLALTGCQLSNAPTSSEVAQINQQVQVRNADQQVLADIITKDWQLKLDRNPLLAASKGENSAAGKLTDMSPQALEQQYQAEIALLAQLRALNPDKLTKAERINALILEYQLANSTDLYRFKDHYIPISSESGFHAYITSISQGRFNRVEDYDNYLTKLSALPTYFAQQTHWLKLGLAQDITPPKATLKGFEDSISAYQVDVEESGYYKPFTSFPKHISQTDQQRLQTEGRKVVEQQVLPLYDDFYDFMTQEYLPGARGSIAAADLPLGRDFYENRVRHYTTLDMSAEEVHQLGLKEVARIRGEMQQIIEELKFEGSFADFLHFLRTDPQFYPKNKQQLLKEAAYIAKRADAMLPKYFATLPRTPYGIKEVPAEIAPKYTTGRYSGASNEREAGYYWVNTYALDKRPLYEMEALTLHEAVPGHHLQIALNQEQKSLPDFRRHSYISAFGEGWGLYAEYLGLEAGFYQDPYSNFGRLTYEMWRACRLVVDTGLHAKGWSRQQAIDYMAANTALSLHNITTEIDRYITWPGQAVSYKIGELTIKRLRKQAEEALGEKFDIRSFHDAILENGSVPLRVLEQQVADYIQRQQSS